MADATNDSHTPRQAPPALVTALRRLDELVHSGSFVGASLAVGSVVSGFVHAQLDAVGNVDYEWLLVLVTLAISAMESELVAELFLDDLRERAQDDVDRQAEVEEVGERIRAWLSGLRDDDEPPAPRFGR